MATTSPTTCLEQIGDTAGLVWATLSQNGPLSLAQVVKNVGRPRDLVMQAVGWFAREEKISIDDEGRKRIISLR